MIPSLATIGFVGAVAAGALMMASKETKLEGDVISGILLEQLKEKGITEMKCKDTVIGSEGAVFECFVWANDGSTATIEYTMNRAGQISGRQVP